MSPRWGPATRVLRGALGLAYGGAVAIRNRYYDRPGAAHRASRPVISVGNLTVGGTGKTPLVAWIASHLAALGRRPAIVSRGYGGRAGRGPLVVSTGAGPDVGPERCGDEPYLLARTVPRALVVVGSDRPAAVERAVALGADVAVLDDGFQHRRLARDLDLLLLDAADPFGGHRLLPAGLLREPLRGLRRADLVLLTRSRPDEPLASIEAVVRRHNPRAPILRTGHRALGFFDPLSRPAERPPRAVAFCGIGNPLRFRADLESLGVDVVEFRPHRDHHPFRAAEVRRLHEAARRHEAALVTTEKDLVRIAGAAELADPALLTLRIEAVVHEPEPLLAAVARALGRGRG